MKQMRLAITGFELKTKRTRKRVFLDEMNLVIPWSALLALIARGCPKFCVNGQLAGNCRTSRKMNHDRKQRIDRPAARWLQKA